DVEKRPHPVYSHAIENQNREPRTENLGVGCEIDPQLVTTEDTRTRRSSPKENGLVPQCPPCTPWWRGNSATRSLSAFPTVMRRANRRTVHGPAEAGHYVRKGRVGPGSGATSAATATAAITPARRRNITA